MTPDSFQTYQRIERELSAVRETMVRIETKINTMCEQRKEQHEEHTNCRASIEKAFEDNDKEHGDMWKVIRSLDVKWKVASGLGGAIIVVLTILNILLSVGTNL
jgi:hypothetical protein